MVRPAGIEPAHPVPETGALSPELRAHMSQITKNIIPYESGIVQQILMNKKIVDRQSCKYRCFFDKFAKQKYN